jgi:SPP1 family phage portal protein
MARRQKPRVLFGRSEIVSDAKEIARENIIDQLNTALVVHWKNMDEIQYLYDYYRGNQYILNKKKKVRPEINNMIVENRANEIVSFKTGYLVGEPVQYVARTNDETEGKSINRLNEYTFAEDKASKDKELADWMHIAGIGYRIVLPDENLKEVGADESPFELYTGDPRTTFVIKRNNLARTPLCSVLINNKADGNTRYYVYTKARYYEIESNVIWVDAPNPLGEIPVIEYPANTARLGAFEIVLPLLDALNSVDSNALDDIEQTVQALLLFHNVDIGGTEFEKLRQQGALKFTDADPTMPGEVKYIVANLGVSETKTMAERLYESILTICGMPNRNGGSSTSDTGAAVIMRDGWSSAEARAKDTEAMFKRSEKEALKLMLKIIRTKSKIDLPLKSIDIRFTRRNYENTKEKAEVLNMMLNNEKIAPMLAFTHSGMFSDPQVAYKMSKEEYENRRKDSEDDPTDSKGSGEGQFRRTEGQA